MNWGWTIAVFALGALACSNGSDPDDGGGTDVGTVDGGGVDGGTDATTEDVPMVDSGRNDSGRMDDGGDDGCSEARPCPGGMYCVYSGTCGGMGTCMPISDFCPEDCPGVCGCDGDRYCNACLASRARVDVDPDGSCEGDFGCAAAAMCPGDQFCEQESCDGDGLCQPRPDTCPGVVDPVCACNGMTYNNACEANRAGQTVARAGAC